MINKAKELFNKPIDLCRQYRQIQRDNLALQLIHDFLPLSTNYFPATTASINPHTLGCILNDIKINQRKYMIEFGGGLSTISCAKFAKLNNIELQLFTVEDNEEYMHILDKILREENLINIVHLIYAPLQPTSLSLENTPWYSEAIKDNIGNTKFDIVLIDGPQAWKKHNYLSRFPALPFLLREKLLAENYAIFFDDTNRKGSQIAIQRWQNEHKVRFVKLSDVASVSFKGNHFNPILW
ncbi:MAG: class I SAM-dependent methyltransferase [Okeania sp. SIO3I5]|uniref:class I SAM-dependent methyltransferase n=1 Tax=Okeania sp. SIO3I5 TaxID=2607805 RepID=UPI0013B6E747|nr:class I SAM-dependent methyltransferase [Okeania sp. SIO3I5]NEQ41000.1 class I SAM-dependent methyltransferase [Okeania sp. SIO3I5]